VGAVASSDVVRVLQILLLNNVDELHEHIDHTQLTPDLGGSLQYDHQQWIQHRAVSIYTISLSLYYIFIFISPSPVAANHSDFNLLSNRGPIYRKNLREKSL